MPVNARVTAPVNARVTAPVNARVMAISRGSLHDGEGVRTVVYLKGCNMRCAWCHNPEGISFLPQILFAESKCMRCGICIETCPEHHILKGAEHIYVKDGCAACGKCAENCPTNALEFCGKEMSAGEVLREILKDKHYFDTSSGGVTFSGGECLLWPDFMREIARLCKESGVSVTVESAMNVPWGNVKPLISLVDSFYVDIKHMDGEVHRKYTGCGNALILENIKKLAAVHKSVLVRTPLIPGVNDSMDNLKKTALFARDCGVRGIELLKYNILGKSKYNLAQESYVSFASEPQSDAYTDEVCRRINEHIGETCFAFWVK